MPTCPEDNKETLDQSSFWDSNGLHWDAHRIGWAISGGCAALTVIITLFSVLRHCRHYYVRAEQRQIIRILYMPPVFAIISFFSYRYFRSYTYYSLVEVIYESFVLSAFLLLIVQYVAATADTRTAEDALARKDKTKLPIPCCCLRYRPTKPYFMYTLKWSVMQYTVIRPACSIAGIVTQYYGVLCEGERSVHYAAVYIEAVDFVSISVALMGLIVFYDLTRKELTGRRPLAKFLCIKLIVMVTFYQSWLFSLLQTKGVIHESEFWTATNVSNGLNALATCIEMVFFAIFMLWAYPVSEYLNEGERRGGVTGAEEGKQDGLSIRPRASEDEIRRRKNKVTSIWRPLWDSINFSDFALEIWSSFTFFFDYALGKPYAHSSTQADKVTFGTAFGIEEGSARGKLLKQRGERRADGLMRIRTPNSEVGTFANSRSPGTNNDYNVGTPASGGMGRGWMGDNRKQMDEAYSMEPITSQPRPRQPPQNGGAPGAQQISLQPPSPQGSQQQRWSTVGLAL